MIDFRSEKTLSINQGYANNFTFVLIIFVCFFDIFLTPSVIFWGSRFLHYDIVPPMRLYWMIELKTRRQDFVF